MIWNFASWASDPAPPSMDDQSYYCCRHHLMFQYYYLNLLFACQPSSSRYYLLYAASPTTSLDDLTPISQSWPLYVSVLPTRRILVSNYSHRAARSRLCLHTRFRFRLQRQCCPSPRRRHQYPTPHDPIWDASIALAMEGRSSWPPFVEH